MLMLLVGILGFTYAVTAVSLGLAIAILIVGLPVAALLLVGAREAGNLVRLSVNTTVGTRIEAPMPITRAKGFWGFVKWALTDSQVWRAIAYFVVNLVYSVFAFSVSVTFLALGLGASTYALWIGYLPLQQIDDGTWHRGAQLMPNRFVESPNEIALFAVAGIIVLLYAWPPINNWLGRAHAALAAALLGPTQGSVQRYLLEDEKLRTAEHSALRMRDIERNLHDITQAQLTAIAIKVGDAKERLQSGEQADTVLNSLSSAHETAKSALADLRGLVQGIHPAALNDGLEVALTTLAASAPIKVDARMGIHGDIAESVEAAVYYSAAELLNNVAKHSGATGAALMARSNKGVLEVIVEDNGRGGAQLNAEHAHGSGTGLQGIAQRLRSVNGTLEINSPEGGPTTIRFAVPQMPKAGK